MENNQAPVADKTERRELKKKLRAWKTSHDGTKQTIAQGPFSIARARSLRMTSRSLRGLAVSCTAFHVLRRERASFST